MEALSKLVPPLTRHLRRVDYDTEDEKEVFIVSSDPPTRKRSRWQQLERLLAVIGAFFLLLSIPLAIAGSFQGPSSAFELGWVTALGPSYPSLRIERVQFDAGLALNKDGELVRTGATKGRRQYVGKPSDEIDANWNLLIPSDMNITRSEAEQIGGEFYFYPGTDIASIEISSFHVLHCLDMVRMSVYKEHYWPDGVDDAQQVHVDVLRQYIQCHIDLTPINLVWSENKGGILPDFRQTHTCRSYREAHEWVLRRNIENYERGIGDEGVAANARYVLEELGWA